MRHPAFCDATERQALRRWQSEPAIGDGGPVGSWQRHAIQFEISRTAESAHPLALVAKLPYL